MTAALCRSFSRFRSVSVEVLNLLTAPPEAGGPILPARQVLYDLLSAAALHDDLPLMRRLLSLPVQPPLSEAGMTPLGNAVTCDSLEGARLLLEHGADPTDGGQGRLLTGAVASRGPLAMVLLLLEFCPLQKRAWALQHATISAAHQNNLAAAQHLLPLSRLAPGDLLQEAARAGSLDVVRRLAEDEDLVSGDEVGYALLIACQHGRLACVEMLLEELQVDVHYARGGALLRAVYQQHSEVVRLLLLSGAVATDALLAHAEAHPLSVASIPVANLLRRALAEL